MNKLRLVATGVISLALLGGATGCGGVSPTEGSGEVRDQHDAPNGLGDEVEEQIDDRLAVGDAEGVSAEEVALLERIDEYEDVSTDTIRVIVEGDLADADRDALAQAVFSASENEALGTVQIVDASGDETEHTQ
ncbi:hypothetical protein SAMN04488565_1679 [Leucobacter chromiiresistens]|uniref:Uncharacterized protein n=1 Tax=Leucobacter chromiiresistens TaxID=1079994 RepID=A0A1H0ZE67_9MICO|nr:hypothetical protein SAMN04488565_1679 [Leucobacter chromiiresistens]